MSDQQSAIIVEIDYLDAAYSMVRRLAGEAAGEGLHEVGAYLYREASRIASQTAIRAQREDLSGTASAWDDLSSECLVEARRYEGER